MKEKEEKEAKDAQEVKDGQDKTDEAKPDQDKKNKNEEKSEPKEEQKEEPKEENPKNKQKDEPKVEDKTEEAKVKEETKSSNDTKPIEEQDPKEGGKSEEDAKDTEEPLKEDSKETPKEDSKDEKKEDTKDESKTESKEGKENTKQDEGKEEAKEKEEAKDGEKNEEDPKEEKKEESGQTSPAKITKSMKKIPKKKKKVKKMVEGEEIEVEEEESEEEEEIIMEDNEYYPEDYQDKELPDSQIPKKYSRFNGIYGMESYKRFNIHLIEPHVLIYANGNTYELYNIEEKTRKILFGRDIDGIGSIAVHPSRKYFAVAEKGPSPNIYIYDYPDLKLYRICRGGTEKAYSHVEFSVNGDKLASVGSSPDYTITVWNWKAQRVILKSKAFAQEVYRVSFSPYTDEVLITSGMGHIKFWKMANTFTGLKLQGELGKYGKLELSDVTGFRELPDGKIVSGTEYGTMILWEGRNIKAHLVQNDENLEPLHKGFLEIVILEDEEFITAGEDGYIKFWNFQEIDSAEFSDEKMEVAIHPTREIFVTHDDGSPAYINQMIKQGDKWILGDARGKIWEIDLKTEEKIELLNFHSGAIADLGVCERKNVAVTLGSEGILKCWDFINEKEIFLRKFLGNGTSLDWLPYNETNKGRILACGFSTGVTRIISIESDNFKLLNSVKSLDCPIVSVKYSPDGGHLATVGKDGTIFFFLLDMSNFDSLEPLCMVKVESDINTCCWDHVSKKFLVGCKNGYVYEFPIPDKNKINVKESFLVEVPIKEWKIKMMEFQMKKNQKKDLVELEKIKRMKLRGELPMEDEEEEDEDWDPEPIQTIKYASDTDERFIITASGIFQSYYYI